MDDPVHRYYHQNEYKVDCRMMLREALAYGAHMLSPVSGESARRDAQELLGHVTGLDRARLLAYPERELSAEQEQTYRELLQRRSQHEPIAYLLGHEEFYGLDFIVDRRVLIPRPETELLVEMALSEIRTRIDLQHVPVVADIGTGSGAIPITIAVEEPRLPYIYACDISANALEVARSNCERHGVTERVRLLQSDLAAALPEPVDILLANLPYVGTEEMSEMNQDVLAYEPHQALFSGPSGLDLLYIFCKEVRQSGTLRDGGIMLLEIGYQQGDAMTHILHELWPEAKVECRKDYAGWDRIMYVAL